MPHSKTTATLLCALLIGLAPIGVNADANERTKDRIARQAERLEEISTYAPRSFQFTNLRDLSSGVDYAAEGGGYLVRSKHALEARVMAADLTPGHAYTLWFIMFNDPGQCAEEICAASDLATAGGAGHFAAGGIAGANGVLNLSAKALAGGVPEGAVFNPALPYPGLEHGNGFGVEVHMIMVDHGRPVLADFMSGSDPDVAGTWGWELTHALPPGPTWIRAAIFAP